jgi:hypothetical protein
MKRVTKSLSILAVGGIFAAVAFAGPGDAYLGYPAVSMAKANAEKKGQYDTIALFRPRAATTEQQAKASLKAKAEKPVIFSANPKAYGVQR